MKLYPYLEVEVTRQDIEDILIAGKEGMKAWGRMEPDLSPEEATERLFEDVRVRFVSDEGEKFSMLLNVLMATIRHFMEDPENHAVTINDEDQLALNMDVIDDEVAWMLIENSLDGGASFEEDNRR